MKRFHEICTTPHVKRAAEVALVGEHDILFVGTWESSKRAIATTVEAEAYSLGFSIQVAHVAPCPCGFWGDDSVPCVCDPAQIDQWRAETWPMRMPDIAVNVPRVRPEDVIAWARRGYTTGEHHDVISRRVIKARERDTPTEVDDYVWDLALALVKTDGLHPDALKTTMGVAATIARMAGADVINGVHFAEAAQYRVSRFT